jgi:tetratricopeptide (TPR) repeat protein
MKKQAATTLTMQEALDLAVKHHQAGRLRDAEGIYRRILEGDPNNAHALHLLGVLASQVGQNDSAVEYIRRAIAQNPTAAQYQCNLGAALVTAGRIEEAIETYQRALLLQPELPDAYANLGIAQMRLGQFASAVESLETAVKSKPDDFKILDSLGSALSQDGRQEDAVGILRRALAIRSDFAPTHHTMGNALVRLNRFDDAIVEYRAALALRPDFAAVQSSLAGLLIDKGLTDEAIDLARRALTLLPNSVAAWYNLGRALNKQNRPKESEDALRRALGIDAGFYLAYNELGNALLAMKRYDEAIEAFNQLLKIEPSGEGRYNLGGALWESGRCEEAIAEYKTAESMGFIDPRLHNNVGAIHHQFGRYEKAAGCFGRALTVGGDFPLARFNLGMIQLLQGDFKEGWIGYESRWKAKSIPMPARYAQLGMWDGGDVRGKRILLDSEQGFGDSIQFARYISLIAERGGQPILATQPELRRLLKTVPGVDRVIAPPEEIPMFDVQCPLLSLGYLFGTTVENIPAKVPYLFADQAAAESWGKRLPRDDRMKIGLCWSGSPKHLQDRVRSLSAEDLVPLGQVAETWYCSLQKASEARTASKVPEALPISDWTGELTDFAETAALIANLDLVISCDTAVAHLAGALGKPVWLLLPHVPDWRWLLERDDSPWYPTMRLFRQAKAGDWRSPIRKAVEALKRFDRERRRGESGI